MILPTQVTAFMQEMEQAVVYAGAMHSFTNPNADAYGSRFNLPFAYNAVADQDSWRQLLDFLGAIFR